MSSGYTPIQVNTNHLNGIYTMLDQRRRRWADLYKCYTNVLCLLGTLPGDNNRGTIL